MKQSAKQSAKKYVINHTDIYNEIQEGRIAKWGAEQLAIFIKQPTDIFDITEMLKLGIGIKIGRYESCSGYDVTTPDYMVKRYYAQVVSFADDEVTDENIKKVIKYLIDFECNVPVVTGVVLSPRKIREI